MTYFICTQSALSLVTPMATRMTRQRTSVPPYGYLAVLGLAAIARNSHAHEADTDAVSSVTISNDASIPNPPENHILTGTVKADKLAGGDGDDEISGDAGYDRLFGHDGNDHLYGGGSNDILGGGEGADTYVIDIGGTADNGHDTIYGFTLSEDIIHISLQRDGATPSTLAAAGLALGTNGSNAVLTDSADSSIIYLTFDRVTQADLVEATHFDFV